MRYVVAIGEYKSKKNAEDAIEIVKREEFEPDPEPGDVQPANKTEAIKLVDYYKFKAVPETGVLQEKFKDFEPDLNVKAETGYYLDKLKNEYLSARLKSIILQGGSALKEDAASRVLADMQSKLAGLARFTNNVRDLDVTDLEAAERHFMSVKDRSSAMGGSPGIKTGFEAID